MRPIKKGDAPRVFTKYQQAGRPLKALLGRFCSYCERFMSSGLAVEHKRPRAKYKLEELEWSNFLLSCHNCNSGKGHGRISLGRYLWPDVDNTFRAFQYDSEGGVRVNRNIPKRLRRKAQRTLQLLGLNRHRMHPARLSGDDYRWSDRRLAWQKAESMRQQLEEYNTPAQVDRVILSQKNSGMVSIAAEVFKGHPRVRRRLLADVEGTDMDCFDAAGRPLPRAGGQI